MSEENKRARDKYEPEDAISDLSDGELDAAIYSVPVTSAKASASAGSIPAGLEGGLFDEALAASSSSSEDEDEEAAADRRLSSLGKEEQVRARLATAHEAMLPVLSALTPEQQHRYETFRRVGFPRPFVKKLIQKAWGSAGSGSTGASAVIVVAGIAKVFVGELVEAAKDVAAEWEHGEYNKPLLPSHYREAHRRLVNAGKLKSNADCIVHGCLL